MRRYRSVLTIPLLAAAVAACGPSPQGDDTGGGGDDGGGGGGDVDAYVPPTGDGDGGGGEATGCEKIDILFVVDNSGSMGQEQMNLATNFPAFMNVIDQSGLDYRVAITTTGVNYTYQQATIPGGPVLPASVTGGDNGAMLQKSDCGMTRRWVEKGDSNAAMAFACAANVGTNGPADEMPLAAMRRAFEARMADGTNGGFRRQDALLAVVFLTDENDCSYEQSVTLPFAQFLCSSMMEPASNYVAFLDQYTGARGRWATAVIAGYPGPGECSSSFGSAVYAERLDQFVQATGQNAVISSICDGDLTTGLTRALDLFDSACDNFPPIGLTIPPSP